VGATALCPLPGQAHKNSDTKFFQTFFCIKIIKYCNTEPVSAS